MTVATEFVVSSFILKIIFILLFNKTSNPTTYKNRNMLSKNNIVVFETMSGWSHIFEHGKVNTHTHTEKRTKIYYNHYNII